MRILPLAAWVAVTMWFLFTAFSDFAFGDDDPKLLAKRCALAFVWPVALFSSAGRKLLLQTGSEL